MDWEKDDIGVDGSEQEKSNDSNNQVDVEDSSGTSNSEKDELQRRSHTRRQNRPQSLNNRHNQGHNKNGFNQNRRHHSLRKKSNGSSQAGGGNTKSISALPPRNDNGFDLEEKGKFFLKLPLPMKIAISVMIIVIPLMILLIFVVIFKDELSGMGTGGMGGAEYEYGTTCTKITVENTGCDEKGENCTHEYDGSVTIEDYIAGVVAAESDGVNNLEYYKLSAVIARTYFHKNAPDDCTVDGNNTFKPYMDVSDSQDAELIKQAVEETEKKVILESENLIDTNYSQACVINADDNNYYIKYGTDSNGQAKLQSIPKSWDSETHAYTGVLSNLYSQVDQTNTDYNNRDCPNNNDSGMSQIGAYYLITKEGYTHEGVIKYYYGSEVSIEENKMQLSGVDGFVNPTRKLYCSSPFSDREDPLNPGLYEFHNGVDIAINGGEPIFAVKDGTIRSVTKHVTYINRNSYTADNGYNFGNYIIIDHEEGISSVYAHMKHGSIPDWVVVGATVMQGEQIGQVGSTGRSTGNHLHYEVRINNKRVDPADYLDLSQATGQCRR